MVGSRCRRRQCCSFCFLRTWGFRLCFLYSGLLRLYLFHFAFYILFLFFRFFYFDLTMFKRDVAWMNTTNSKTIDKKNEGELNVRESGFGFVSGWLASNIQSHKKFRWCMWNIGSVTKQTLDGRRRRRCENVLAVAGSECSTRWNHLLRRKNDARANCLICQKWEKVGVEIWTMDLSGKKQRNNERSPFHSRMQQQHSFLALPFVFRMVDLVRIYFAVSHTSLPATTGYDYIWQWLMTF